jgi:hypothetical protein
MLRRTSIASTLAGVLLATPIPTLSNEGATVIALNALARAFQENELAANALYRDRLIAMIAAVDGVTADPPAARLLGEEGMDTRLRSVCIFAPGAVAAATKLKKGTCAVFRGKVATRDGHPYLEDCSVVQVLGDQTMMFGEALGEQCTNMAARSGFIVGSLVPGDATSPKNPTTGSPTAVSAAPHAAPVAASTAPLAKPESTQPPKPSTRLPITKATFSQLKKGMTYDDVVAKLGVPSSCNGTKEQSMGCSWTNTDGSGVATWFHNGKLTVLHADKLPE